MKKFWEKFSGFILFLAELIIGVLLLIRPEGFTAGIIIGLGAAMLVLGLVTVTGYFRAEPAEAAKSRGLAKGLCFAAAGIFCIINHKWVIDTFPVLSMLYGAAILVTGLVRTQWAVDMLRIKHKRWHWIGINAAISVICAILILVNPFGASPVLWIFIGVLLIVEAVLDAISMILTGRAPKKEAPAA